MSEINNSNIALSFKELWRPLSFVVVIITLFLVSRFYDFTQELSLMRSWIKSLGIYGPIIFIFISAFAVIIALPRSAIAIFTSVLFGPKLGIIVISIASTIGASLSFLIARYFVRGSITDYLMQKRRFRKLNYLTKQHGFIIVALTRLIPVFPYSTFNYSFGLTGISFWKFMFWSWICSLPILSIYVFGTNFFEEYFMKGDVPWITISVVVIASVWFVYVFRKSNFWRKFDELDEANNAIGEN